MKNFQLVGNIQQVWDQRNDVDEREGRDAYPNYHRTLSTFEALMQAVWVSEQLGDQEDDEH